MNTIDNAINVLLDAIKQSEEYRAYRYQLEKINMQPELRSQIDAYRDENFALQNNTPDDQLLWQMEQFEEKYRKFRENPLVSDFLAAELAFVRMMQEINLKVAEGIQFE
ncbi:MAG: YlbF family regulator [Lachnospiraceae bacterium]|nr:YlbF family regulator [Lachnospiraceae bacterium]